MNRRDRISELPDAVLSHILTFLETKWAFRTTALAKRWTNLVWNSLSTLHFDESNFRKQSQFRGFMYHVVGRRDKTLPLHKFIFTTFRSTSGTYANSLLSKLDYAMSTLTHLQLCVPQGYMKIDPVLNSLPMSLRVLQLNAKAKNHGDGFIKMKTLFCLPKLDILHLQGFELELGPNLLSECENLVEISIVRCLIKENLIISAPKLASLTISYISHSGNATIVLMVPKLTLFKFKAGRYEFPVIHTDEFLHLKTAILKTGIKIQKQELMMNVLQKLSDAQHLSLSLPTLKLLHQIGGTLKVPVSPFSNLKTFAVTIKEKIEYGWEVLLHEPISVSVINQVLNTVFQRSSDVESFVHFPRPSKRPRI